MNLKRKVLAVILLLVVLLNIIPIRTLAYNSDSKAKSSKDFDYYIDQVLPHYIDTLKNTCKISASTKVEVSQSYEILNDGFENNGSVIVFVDARCVGLITWVFNEGRYVSSFTPVNCEIINSVLKENVAFLFFGYEKTLQMYDGKEAMFIAGSKETKDVSSEVLKKIDREKKQYMQSIALRSVNVYNNDEGTGSINGSNALMGRAKTLSVPIVRNGFADGFGICWAASMASIVSYRRGEPAKTALQLYNEIKRARGTVSIGDEACIRFTFGYYGVDYNFRSRGLRYSEVVSIIQNNRPIYVATYGVGENGSEYGHALVLCGYQSAQGGYYYYTFMDSDCNYKVTVQVEYNDYNFEYATVYGAVFNDWYRTFY